MSEVLGIKTVLLSAKCSGTVPPSNSVSIKEEMRAQTPGTPVGTMWYSIRTRSPIFLHSNEFVKLGLVNSPDGCRQELFEQIVGYPQLGDVSGLRHVLGKWFPNTHKAFFLIHPRFPRDGTPHQ